MKRSATGVTKTPSNSSQKSAKPNNQDGFSPSTESGFLKTIEESRVKTASSVLEFHFQKKRVRVLTEATEVKESAGSILYWMSRDCRVQDNWAFLFAQKLALKNRLPLHVCFCLVPKFLDATIRHYKFMLKGLQEVCQECKDLDINFHLLLGSGGEKIPEFVKEMEVGAVVCDFSPLRVPLKWLDDVKNNLQEDVPLCQVDAHNIVPVWVTSDKQEYAARTIRNKINGKLDVYLTEFPPVIKHPFVDREYNDVDWPGAFNSLECNREVEEVDWAQPGYKAACRVLETFCSSRLKLFNSKRNDPTVNALSNLAPWFHFGHISVQRCVLAVRDYKSKYPESVAAFCEEAIVRRELSDNFCFYNEHYDSLKGLASWAEKTLSDHRKDKRTYIYTTDELENAKTHDDLWNSAQIQLVKEAKIHGFLRMYWAKKILEWTESPEKALQVAIYLNDKYSLDGRDPNGYVGCMWSIGGIHDQGWREREIFGKIRYMNYDGCKRKFDVPAFVARYGGKVYSKKK
ncbi:deoxyribodipyrimidine photo-lyase [Hermetia illucens]|nr:deoxyribodipyrimidine photo-lyase [Hermetia illucens]XP_037914406.1 deoxyribodipyrimidine photo-lyase [Hermetia illucens]XP_037914415.1 deoxyribodipyrimidine photo-lyase [Hermetia illucens]